LQHERAFHKIYLSRITAARQNIYCLITIGENKET